MACGGPAEAEPTVLRSLCATAVQENGSLPVPVGRNHQNLFKVLPGFTPPENAHSVPSNPSRALVFNVNGASRQSNNTRIDGVSTTNIWLPHVVAYVNISYRTGRTLYFDPVTYSCKGDAEATAMFTRNEYRPPFAIPHVSGEKTL